MEEANLSRLFKHMENEEIGIISAFRLDYDKSDEEFKKMSKTLSKSPNALRVPRKVNMQNSKELLSKLRNKGYGPVKLIGHYFEKNPSTGKEEKVKEISFFVKGHGDGNLKKDLSKLGKEYNQDSILYKAKGKNAFIVALKSSVFQGDIGKWKGSPREVQRMMSKVRNRPFIFETVEDKPTKMGGLLGAMAQRQKIRIIEKGILAGKNDKEILDDIYGDSKIHQYPYTLQRREYQIKEIRELMLLPESEQVDNTYLW